MPIQNVALIGAAGTLGPSILAALERSPLTPFVLTRPASKSTYPTTPTLTIPPDLNVAALTALFKDHAIDALVIAIAGSYVDEAKRLIDAAFLAGVRRVIPADFGSCDSHDAATVSLLPLMAGKKRVREYLEVRCGEAREGPALTWTSLVTGHFFDASADFGLLKFDVPARRAFLIDGGDVRFSASDLAFVGDAVVRVLEREAATANRLLYVHNHSVTQNEMVAVFERVTGETFARVREDSDELIGAARPRMLEGDAEATEEVVAVHGVRASNWVGKEGFANGLLGLQEGDLETSIRRAIQR